MVTALGFTACSSDSDLVGKWIMKSDFGKSKEVFIQFNSDGTYIESIEKGEDSFGKWVLADSVLTLSNEAGSFEYVITEREKDRMTAILKGFGVTFYFEKISDNSSNDSVADNESLSSEQVIEAKKLFIEAFYNGLESSGNDNAYITKNITAKAKKTLIDEYDYECYDGDCLAVWLFAYEPGSDVGPLVSRTIKVKDENNFFVVTKYVDAEYEARLTVIEDGDSYKIDDIEKVRCDYDVDTSDYSSTSDDDSFFEENSSSSSRTFANEQYVIMYLANQTFRADDGFTIKFDGSGRMYAEGDFAGVVSVLNYNSKSAFLRYGGGQYPEGRFRVDIIGDKLRLTDPEDGTEYYQR